jgi:hypothetical protein
MAGVSADSLREALHPAEYEARTILGVGGGGGRGVGGAREWVDGERTRGKRR